MRIDSNQDYILRNDALAHVEKFYPGTETEAAHFFGSIAGQGLHNWRPDGVSTTHSDFDIVKRATDEESVSVQVGIGKEPPVVSVS